MDKMNSVKDANSYIIAIREIKETDTTDFLKIDFFKDGIPPNKIKEYDNFSKETEGCRIIMGSREGDEHEQFIFDMFEEIEEKTKGFEPDKKYEFSVDLENGDVEVTVQK